jgi:hypothetical protein
MGGEGDRWAIRFGRRYDIFGYEKRMPGTVDDIDEMAGVSGHIDGDVANAILSYGATKVHPGEITKFDISVCFVFNPGLLQLRRGFCIFFSFLLVNGS